MTTVPPTTPSATDPSATDQAATEQAQERLAARYGRTPHRRGRRYGLMVTAVVGVLLGVGWAAWVAWGVAAQPVRWTDVGYVVRGDGVTQVTFDVTMEPGTTAVCTVRALNHAFAEVGLLDVTVGPSTRDTVRSVIRIPTSELAVTGVVKACQVR